jgi:hypothetical protein
MARKRFQALSQAGAVPSMNGRGSEQTLKSDCPLGASTLLTTSGRVLIRSEGAHAKTNFSLEIGPLTGDSAYRET